MADRRLSSPFDFIRRASVFLFTVAIVAASQPIKQNYCQCLNKGTCGQNEKYASCTCAPGFIGTNCQTAATEINTKQQQALITQDYTYFYFQPKQINYYQIGLKICLSQSQNKKLTNLIFLEVQRNSGKLKLQPSIYQTSPIFFQGKTDRCQTFYTHFIPIRKKINNEYQKIIFGVAIKNNSDIAANRWVNFLQKSTSKQQSVKDSNLIFHENQNQAELKNETQIQNQIISISCTYELYLVQNYWGKFIMIMSAITLFTSVGVFLYTVRNKYSHVLSSEEIFRLYVLNPEDFPKIQRRKNDLSHFQLIMPKMSYQLLVDKEKRSQEMHLKNKQKKRMQMHNLEQKSLDPEEKPPSQRQKLCLSDNNSVLVPEEISVQIQNGCSICLINFERKDNIRQTPCRHVFHANCIDNWCQTTLNCPICRRSLQISRIMARRQLRTYFQN